jgi:hypothetical protein
MSTVIPFHAKASRKLTGAELAGRLRTRQAMQMVDGGLKANLSVEEICQLEIKRETEIISAAMDRLAGYATPNGMVDVVEGLLERKTRS